MRALCVYMYILYIGRDIVYKKGRKLRLSGCPNLQPYLFYVGQERRIISQFPACNSLKLNTLFSNWWSAFLILGRPRGGSVLLCGVFCGFVINHGRRECNINSKVFPLTVECGLASLRYGSSHPTPKRALRALKRVFSIAAPIQQKSKKAPTTESDECPWDNP